MTESLNVSLKSQCSSWSNWKLLDICVPNADCSIHRIEIYTKIYQNHTWCTNTAQSVFENRKQQRAQSPMIIANGQKRFSQRLHRTIAKELLEFETPLWLLTCSQAAQYYMWISKLWIVESWKMKLAGEPNSWAPSLIAHLSQSLPQLWAFGPAVLMLEFGLTWRIDSCCACWRISTRWCQDKTELLAEQCWLNEYDYWNTMLQLVRSNAACFLNSICRLLNIDDWLHLRS